MTKPDPSILTPLDGEAWPDALDDLKDDFCGQLNVYRTMAHHPALVRAWVDLRQHIVRETALGRVRSEVVILRAAFHLKSDYEWKSHVARARDIGMTDARITTLQNAPDAMAPDDAVLAQAVDALMERARLDRSTLTALTALVGKPGVLDLMATVGFYSTLAFILNTFETPLDEVVAAQLIERPLTP